MDASYRLLMQLISVRIVRLVKFVWTAIVSNLPPITNITKRKKKLTVYLIRIGLSEG